MGVKENRVVFFIAANIKSGRSALAETIPACISHCLRFIAFIMNLFIVLLLNISATSLPFEYEIRQ